VVLDYKIAEINRIIEMAWEDRTPFEAIEYQFGIKENDVRKIMRSNLKGGLLNYGEKESKEEKLNIVQLLNPQDLNLLTKSK